MSSAMPRARDTEPGTVWDREGFPEVDISFEDDEITREIEIDPVPSSRYPAIPPPPLDDGGYYGNYPWWYADAKHAEIE